MTNDFGQYMARRQEEREQEKRIYAELRRNLLNSENIIEAIEGQMPISKPFYTFQVTMGWVRQRVHLVGEMTMFNQEEEKYTNIGDTYGNIEITSDSIDLVRQRPVNFSRAMPISKYLLTHPLHSLPDLVLVISADWVDNPESPNWGPGKRALTDSCDIERFDDESDSVLLHLPKQEKKLIYALDGQHRLIGIRAALQMLSDKMLQERRPNGEFISKKTYRLEDWLDEIEEGGSKVDLSRFNDEQVGIKLIPAVCKGETWEEAIQRVASIFKAFNMTAEKISAGAMASMDQESIFAIAARGTWKKHPFLMDLDKISGETARPRRISPTNNTIAAKSTTLTTLATLKSMSEQLLKNDPSYADLYKRRRGMLERPPSNDDVREATDLLIELWNGISSLPSMREIEPPIDRNVAEMRRFPSEGQEGEAHLLFRPLGQQALASAVGTLINRHSGPMSFDEIFTVLKRYDQSGGFCMVDRKNPWFGVMYDPRKEKLIGGGWNLCAELLAYMIGGDADLVKRRTLLDDFANARRSGNDDLAWNLKGDEVPVEDIVLPPVLT